MIASGFVCENGPKRGDDFDQAGDFQVGDDSFDVFINHWRFFVEKVAVFTDDASAQGRVGQLIGAEAFANARFAGAAGVFAPGAMREGPCGILRRAFWKHEIAVRASGSCNDNRSFVGGRPAFAMNPKAVLRLYPVVGDIQNRLHFGSQRRREPFCDQRTTGLGPTDGKIVSGQVIGGGPCVNPGGAMLRGMRAEDAFAQAARTAVHEKNEMILAQTEAFEFGGTGDFLHRLKLSEVITTTKGAKGSIERGRFLSRQLQTFTHIAVPWHFEIELDVVPTVELHLLAEQICFPKPHAAANVVTDQVRIDDVFGHERRAYRRAFARVQIGKPDRLAHTFQFRNGIQLANRFAFDPALRRSDEPDDTII